MEHPEVSVSNYNQGRIFESIHKKQSHLQTTEILRKLKQFSMDLLSRAGPFYVELLRIFGIWW